MQLEGMSAKSDDLRSLALGNYGNFTSMRVEGMRVRGLSVHLDRLVGDSEQLFGQSVDPERVRQLVRQAVSDAPDPIIVRVTVFAPDFTMSQPSRKVEPKILVTLRPAPPVPQAPLRVKLVQYERELPLVKHVGLFGQLWQRRLAQINGFDDALFVDSAGRISEGATWNIAFMKSNQATWPSATYLPGVTMRLIQALMSQAGIESVTAPVHAENVSEMQCAFATNAATGLRLISEVDDYKLTTDWAALEALSESYLTTPGEPL